MRIVVIIPGNATTGGVELLYQFVDAANSAGASAFACLYPFNSNRSSISDSYREYNCRIILRSSIRSDDVIVLPEVYTYIADQFPKNRVYLWWLSVDNYYGSRSLKYMAGNLFSPWRFKSIENAGFSSYFAGHLCQSQYAVDHLKKYGIDCDFFVSDYINQSFLVPEDARRNSLRRDLVVFNPAKGVEQTQRIAKASSFEFHPIKGMKRFEVIDLLLSAKVYIDFGNHPGKDRIPREAAALGCVVITNRRGSALNSADVAIDPLLKIDDSLDDFVSGAVSRIDDVMSNFGMYYEGLESYRNAIMAEKRDFFCAVARFVRSVEG